MGLPALDIDELLTSKLQAAPEVPRLRTDVVDVVTSFQEDGLSADFFRHFCGVDDLDEVDRLELQVDGVSQSLECIGEHLRNLKQLKLLSSSVLSIRDLGTDLRQVQVLWLSRCGLQDLGGLAACLPHLREFYLPFNDVSDLSALSGHDCLEVLDLEGNCVADVDELETLRTCPNLRELTLSDNPVLRSGPAALTRRTILGMLPQLAVLDDLEASTVDLKEVSASTRAPTQADADSDLEFDLKLYLNDVGVRGGAVSAHRNAHVDVEASDDDSCSIESIDNGIAPLNPKHPLLAAGLSKSAEAHAAGAEDPADAFVREPDEFELVSERLRRPRPMLPHGHTDRPAMASGFSLQLANRRPVWTEPASYRPTTTGSAIGTEEVSPSQDTAASDLTTGDSLAGGPLAAVRQRRKQASALLSREAEMDIRELLRRYQTYTQLTSGGPARHARRVQTACGAVADEGTSRPRPCTPNVRIRSTPEAARMLLAGRRPSSSGSTTSLTLPLPLS